MQELSSQIYQIIQDYHCDECNAFEQGRILEWVNQFDENDREFVLQEFLHLLKKGIYVSKVKASILLWDNFNLAAKKLGYGDLKKFVYETHFFNTQAEGKSQTVLFGMLNTIVLEKVGIGLNTDAGHPAKNFIYIDDVVATGKTVLNTIKNWMDENENAKKIVSGEYKCVISVFCMHQWAFSNFNWILKSHFKENAFLKSTLLISNYTIENIVRFPSAKLNLTYPTAALSDKAADYFENLDAEDHEDRAFRGENQPRTESFFSSAENRNRLEAIFIEKGVEILERVMKKNPAHRPLGATYPNYKTLGTGTLFFTWRNISNTCPLVFWWNNTAHDWKCLFPVRGRGN